jgi:hypothetical protein
MGAVVAGCAVGTPATSGRLEPAQLSAMADPAGGDVLSGLQIRQTGAPTAYDAIRRLRPELLHRRGTTSAGNPDEVFPAVYLDRTYLGSVEQLQGISAGLVSEVRYLSGTAAREWVNSYHPAGVILVSARKQRP